MKCCSDSALIIHFFFSIGLTGDVLNQNHCTATARGCVEDCLPSFSARIASASLLDTPTHLTTLEVEVGCPDGYFNTYS